MPSISLGTQLTSLKEFTVTIETMDYRASYCSLAYCVSSASVGAFSSDPAFDASWVLSIVASLMKSLSSRKFTRVDYSAFTLRCLFQAHQTTVIFLSKTMKGGLLNNCN